MSAIKRALLLATLERYINLIVGFLLIAIISRLLAPEEVGVSVIGVGVMAIVMSLREFASPNVLIQRPEVTNADIRTAITVMFLSSAFLAAATVATAPWLAGAYGEPILVRYLQIMALASLLEAFSQPIIAVLKREMAFGVLAVVNVAATIAGAAVSIVLALLGHGAMSYAWAALTVASVTAALAFCVRPDPGLLRPSLQSWRSALTFGGYNGAITVINKAYETVPQLVLGRMMPIEVVGLYSRAVVVAGTPDRLVLAGIFSMAFPALASEAREGRCLKHAFLTAVSHITVLYWPALTLLAFVAHPAVTVLLGDQWLGIVPLVQIMCLAGLFWFAGILGFPILAATGAVRDALVTVAITQPISVVILCLASFIGVEAMALSQFLTLPLQMMVTLHFIRRHVHFEWWELGQVLLGSGVATLASCLGPLAILLLSGLRFDFTVTETILVVMTSFAGWLLGLRFKRHPMLAEFQSLSAIARNSVRLGLHRSPANHNLK